MTPKQKIKALDGLMSSEGWALVVETMQQEILGAALNMANTAQMSEDEMHFRRGSIWAAKQLVDLPGNMRQRLESETSLNERLNESDDDA